MRVWLVGKHFLHDCAVKPSTVFAADLALDADLHKANDAENAFRLATRAFARALLTFAISVGREGFEPT